MLEQIISLDNAALQALQSISNPALDITMLAITFLGSPVFWILVSAFFCWSGKENESFHIVSITAISALLVGALKNVFLRPRPSELLFRVVPFDTHESYSFPSGHATLATAQFAYAKKFLKKKFRIIFAIIVALVIISRIYLRMHFFTDVLAGALLGWLIGKAYFAFARRIGQSGLRLTKSGDALAIVLLIIGTIALVGAVQSIPFSMVLIGYYAGFFLLKEIGLHEKKLSKKKHLIKQTIGFVVLAYILASALFAPVFELPQYFLAGFWISCLWPLIFEKLARHD